MIRHAESNDLDGIMDIIRKITICPDKNIINLWDENYPTREIFSQDIDNKHLFICETQGIMAGVFALVYEADYAAEVSWLYQGAYLVIHRFCVTPELHGKGVAQAMLTFIEGYAFDNGYKALRLDTFSGNARTNRLYTKSGYRYAGAIRMKKGIYNCYEKEIVN